MRTSLAAGFGSLVCAAALASLPGCRGAAPRAAPSPEAAEAERASAAGAVGSLTPDDWRDDTASTVEELIAGRVAGLQVIRRSDGGFSLRIRGLGSLSGSSEPLVVIDGVPVRVHAMGFALAGLNPRDVARVEVLRDAASAAIYGMRAANGVILITTKRAP